MGKFSSRLEVIFLIDMRMRLPDEFRDITLEEMQDFYGKYNEVLDVYSHQETSATDLLTELNNNQIDIAVVHAEYEFGENATHLNERLANLVATYPTQLIGFGTVDLQVLQASVLVKMVDKIHALGMKGINLQPIFFDVDPLDRRLYPLYARAEQLGLIVSFHTGIHFSLKNSFVQNNPLFIDQIAVDFPQLHVIACHAGWPWTSEMAAVARRHANVYIEFGGLDPKYIGVPGTGWDALFTLMNNLLSDQILFGTDWPVISQETAIQGWQQSGLKEEVLEKLFYKNAQKLLQL